MAFFRTKHIKENTIAMVPVNEYLNSTNYSPYFIRWSDFVAFSKGKVIAHTHALYGNGEKKISGVSVNGCCEATNTIFQFHLNFSLLNRKL